MHKLLFKIKSHTSDTNIKVIRPLDIFYTNLSTFIFPLLFCVTYRWTKTRAYKYKFKYAPKKRKKKRKENIEQEAKETKTKS